MTSPSKPRRLSETVVPGKDYEDKVKIDDILDRDVLILSFETAEGDKQYAKVNPETGEIEVRDYLNIQIEDDGMLKTFCTGAIPITKVLFALQEKLIAGEAELPLLAAFRREGRTYVVE